VVLAEGAFFKGKVEMTGQSAKPAAGEGAGKPAGGGGNKKKEEGA
jgi:hypothetical protein